MTSRLRWVGLGLFTLSGVVAWACLGTIYDTVHYSDGVVDFGAPPAPLIIRSWPHTEERSVPGDRESDDLTALENERNSYLAQGTMYEKSKDYASAIRAYRRCLDIFGELKSKGQTDSGVPVDEREAVRERVEVLGLADSQDRRSFLTATRFEEKADMGALTSLAQKKSPMQAHARYRLASPFRGSRRATASAFLSAAALGGPRREPGLMMASRALLGTGETPPTSLEIKLARGHLTSLLKEKPNSRFSPSARNWLARCDLLEGKLPEAQREYMRLYAGASSTAEKINVLASMKEVFAKMSPMQGDSLRLAMLMEPKLLQPYLDYRLRYDGKQNPQQLMSFAKWFLDKKPSATVSGEIAARLAEIAYMTQDYVAAVTWADRSLAVPNDRIDLATYVRAGALQRIGKSKAAAELLAPFPAKFPKSYLVKSSRELLALSYESQEQWAKAFQVYSELNYSNDLAYLIDIRMPLDSLKQVVSTLKPGPAADKLKVALGMRYLRKNMLKEAESTLAAVPDETRNRLLGKGKRDFAWPESSQFDQIPDALQTTRDLIQLRMNAKDSAAGLYELGSYYYTRRNLLLYNASLWQGMRVSLGSLFWNKEIETKGDRLAVMEHNYEHECLFQARRILLQSAETGKGTEVAAKALYRAACASRRLASFNQWWRAHKGATNYWSDSQNLMRRVYQEYPQSSLAANARKYEKVFKEEADGTDKQSMFGTVGLAVD